MKSCFFWIFLAFTSTVQHQVKAVTTRKKAKYFLELLLKNSTPMNIFFLYFDHKKEKNA